MWIKLQHAGRCYWVERTVRPSGVLEHWIGIGYVGCVRRKAHEGNAEGTRWWAAQNPSGKPYKATARMEGLPSRRQAVAWLLRSTDSR